MDRLFRCAWERVLFIHYEVDPVALQPQVPFPLETFRGRAYVSLVAFTLRGLRFKWGPPLATHGFLNVRTYLPGRGIYFLAEWLPHPLCVFLGPRLYGLPYRLGRLDYRHAHETGRLAGREPVIISPSSAITHSNCTPNQDRMASFRAMSAE